MEARDVSPVEREQNLLRMKGDCEDAIKLLEEAVAIRSTNDIEVLLDWWRHGLSAINALFDVFHDDPTRDIGSLEGIMLWFMVSHSGGLDELKRGIHQMKASPNTNRIRKSQRRG